MLQFVGMIVSGLGTIAYVAYRVGKLEGLILEKLRDFERRLEELEGDRRHFIRRQAGRG